MPPPVSDSEVHVILTMDYSKLTCRQSPIEANHIINLTVSDDSEDSEESNEYTEERISHEYCLRCVRSLLTHDALCERTKSEYAKKCDRCSQLARECLPVGMVIQPYGSPKLMVL